MKRVFVFSYHGKDTYQTSFYRLASLSEKLSEQFKVYFIYGNLNPIPIVNENENLKHIPLVYSNGFIKKTHTFLHHKRAALGKAFLMCYYLVTKREILDLQREAEAYFEKNNINLTEEDTIFVSFPSLAVHNLGYALKQKFKSKLILEYRDPGVFGYQLVFENELISKARKLFLKRNEIRNLESADLILAISESIKSFFPKKYEAKLGVIKNGFSSSHLDFSLIKDDTQKFILAYLGSVYQGQLENFTFFSGAKKFIDKYKISPGKFLIKFIGLNDPKAIEELSTKFELNAYIEITPKVPIEKAYEQMYNASMFFHLKYGDRRGVITTKQYDYLAFQKPILLPVDDNGDLAESIKKYKAGFICNNEEEIMEVLNNAFEKHFSGKPSRIERTAEELHELSRKGQEEKLVKLIQNL